jgi:hypothetical protein
MKKDNKERLFEVMKKVNPELLIKESYMQEAPINQNDDQIGNYILNALNTGFYNNLSKSDNTSQYDRKEIYTFNVGKNIRLEYIDQQGVGIFVDNQLKKIDSNLAVKIYNVLKTLA